MRRCTGVISTSWGQACSASCALASCSWGSVGFQDTVISLITQGLRTTEGGQ